jgi:hypothetical protein
MKRTARALRLAACGYVASALAAGLLACGYSFTHGGKLPGGAGTLAVEPVKNRTALAEVGGLFEGALKDELIARGQLAQSGPALDLEVLAVRSSTSALSGGGAAAFRLDAELRARVRDVAGKDLYDDKTVLGEDYLAGEDVAETEANRRAALRRLARSAARELIERMAAAGRLQK